MSFFCAPDLNPVRLGGEIHSSKVSDTSTDLSEVETSDTEMSDGGPRRVGRSLRLTGAQSALIRFLRARNVRPKEIAAHPECGWVVETIQRHNKMSNSRDSRYITPDFYRILQELKETRKETRRNMPPKMHGNPGQRVNPTPASRRTRRSQTTKDVRHGDARHVDLNEPMATAPGSLAHTDQPFLRRFVQSAALEPHCTDLLEKAGFKDEGKSHMIAKALGTEEEVGRFVAAEFTTISAVDKVLLAKALLRLAKS
ncbi:hypothetical protein C8R47DRAFT_1144051 [Mycena vitilis]|nr:hypothetical protein C8R47DRAFT_1144051 [Mycena vitilis]